VPIFSARGCKPEKNWVLISHGILSFADIAAYYSEQCIRSSPLLKRGGTSMSAKGGLFYVSARSSSPAFHDTGDNYEYSLFGSANCYSGAHGLRCESSASGSGRATGNCLYTNSLQWVWIPRRHAPICRLRSSSGRTNVRDNTLPTGTSRPLLWILRARRVRRSNSIYVRISAGNAHILHQR